VLGAREHAPTPSSYVVFIFGLAVESIKELRGASPILFGGQRKGGLPFGYLTSIYCHRSHFLDDYVSWVSNKLD
jgi:hypothetical protein